MAKKKKQEEAQGAPRRNAVRENVEAVLVAVLFALFVRTYLVQAFQIPTSSMERDLLVGDHLLVNKFLFGPASPFEKSFLPMREVRRFDVVIFKYPVDPAQDFVKRVIGMPGDSIEVLNHKLYLNGRLLPEEGSLGYQAYHVATTPAQGQSRYETRFGPEVVPPGGYFVMGDNRDRSADSREWDSVPKEYVKGRPLFIYWSYEAERESHIFRGWGEKAAQILDRVVHFFDKTRWRRTFRPVR